MKKLVSILLIVILIFSVIPSSALSARYDNITISNNYIYSISGGKATILFANTFMKGNVKIPSTLDGYPVKTIDRYAFSDCKDLKSVTIPSSITTIGSFAFKGCNNLTAVYTKDLYAWLNISFGNALANPLYYAKNLYIDGELLTEVDIPEGIDSIHSCAFCNCENLKSISIPDSVTQIGASAFSGTAYFENKENWENNALYIDNKLIDVDIKTVGTYQVKENTKVIADAAFSSCERINKIILNDGISNIGESTFYNCGALSSITIPKGVKNIGYSAFKYCGNLKSVELPNGLENILGSAFYGCKNLKSVTIPESVIKISNTAFKNCENLVAEVEKDSYAESFCTDNNINYTYICHHPSVRSTYNEATCVSTGFKDRIVCETCGKIVDEGTEIPKTSHKMVEVFTSPAATPTNDGNILKQCSVCNIYSNVVVKKASNIKLSSTSYTYNGKVQKPSVTVKDSENNTIPSSNYTITYSNANSTNAGEYDVTVIFKGNYAGAQTLSYKINAQNGSKFSAKLSTTAYTFNNDIQNPSVTVKNAKGKTLKNGTDYTVAHTSDQIDVGTHKIIVTFNGNYSGTKYLYFKINPVKTTVSKLTAGKKSIKVNISKKSTQVTGYQIQYSTSKAFKSAKTTTVKSYKTTSVNLTKLSAQKTYYVRVRTYKTVNNTKYYSGWSTAKSIKTK